jgi:hypothetical protein
MDHRRAAPWAPLFSAGLTLRVDGRFIVVLPVRPPASAHWTDMIVGRERRAREVPLVHPDAGVELMSARGAAHPQREARHRDSLSASGRAPSAPPRCRRISARRQSRWRPVPQSGGGRSGGAASDARADGGRPSSSAASMTVTTSSPSRAARHSSTRNESAGAGRDRNRDTALLPCACFSTLLNRRSSSGKPRKWRRTTASRGSGEPARSAMVWCRRGDSNSHGLSPTTP